MTACSRLPMARSGPGISAIFASTALSPSALSARGPRRAAAFSSWTRSFIATRSSSVNPLNVLPVAVLLLADFCVAFVPGFLSAIVFADLLRAALSRGPDVTDRTPASYFSGSPYASSAIRVLLVWPETFGRIPLNDRALLELAQYETLLAE